jgi:hypothetical protein
MDWGEIFAIANTVALASWIALIVLPRWRWVTIVLRCGVIAVLCVAYATLVFVYFFRVEGGGFGSLAGVATLFASPPVLLAGWIHYLAFDLFVGTWIAERADARGLSRVVQAPILAATFMFGPLGYLIYILTELAPELTPSPQSASA